LVLLKKKDLLFSCGPLHIKKAAVCFQSARDFSILLLMFSSMLVRQTLAKIKIPKIKKGSARSVVHCCYPLNLKMILGKYMASSRLSRGISINAVQLPV